MEYAHYAIITQGDLRNALKRITGIQAFRELYHADNSVEQGLQMLEALIKQQPGLLLCIDVDSVTLEGLHVMEIGALNPPAALGVHPDHEPTTIGESLFWAFTT